MIILNKEDFKKLPKEARTNFINRGKVNADFLYMRNNFPKYFVEEDKYNEFYIVFNNNEERETFKNDCTAALRLIELQKALNRCEAPAEVFEEMKEWIVVNKSPYSASFYNTYGIDWNYKPEGSLRISDHWNFESQGETHCKLDTTNEYLSGIWILARYENGVYKEIKRFN